MYLGKYLLGPNDTPENGIYTGDARILSEAVPDESVSLIFTDPPYAREFVYLFSELAKIGKRVLYPESFCITLSGAAYLDSIIPLMSNSLDYYWLGGMPHTMGHVARYHPRQILNSAKPVLWYAKGTGKKHSYVFDYFPSKIDKDFHEWGQPVPWFAYYIEKLTNPSDIILDPFTGGGAIPAACKILGRKYLAFEISETVAEQARERVRNTQPPLFVLAPEQIAMEFPT